MAPSTLKKIYKKTLYTPLKALEREARSLYFSTRKRYNPTFHSFRSYGIPTGVTSQKEFFQKKIYPSYQIERSLPKPCRHELHPRFYQEESIATHDAYLTLLEQGFSTSRGSNLSSDGYLVAELAEEFTAPNPKNNFLFKLRRERFSPKISHFKGSVASLSTSCQNNYYHWLFDLLPRLHLLEKGGITPNYYYVDNSQPFQRESLEILGISSDKIIPCEEEPYISADTLVVPSFILYPCHKLEAGAFPLPPWIHKYLRDSFLPQPSKRSPSKIYISRSDAKRRRILNESDFLPQLKKLGFTVIIPGELTFKEQVALFQNADIVVSPHGAGLSNLIFAPPNTKVLEIFAPRSTCVCFWIISCLGGLNYSHLYGEENHPETHSEEDCGFDDIIVESEKLLRLVKALC